VNAMCRLPFVEGSGYGCNRLMQIDWVIPMNHGLNWKRKKVISKQLTSFKPCALSNSTSVALFSLGLSHWKRFWLVCTCKKNYINL